MQKKEKIEQSLRFLRSHLPENPDIAVILGSGLGSCVDAFDTIGSLATADIPHYPVSTVPGHSGMMTLATSEGKYILLIQGRVHYYEGYSAAQVALPVLLLARMGLKNIIITCAAGGINSGFRPGDLMLITDHINFTFANPIIGPAEEQMGVRFPDMYAAYDRRLVVLASELAHHTGVIPRKGVLAWMSGPSYETRAEIAMLRKIGADAVSMSVVPEVIAAVQHKMCVAGIALITNMSTGITGRRLSHKEVLEMTARSKPLFSAFLRKLCSHICITI